LNTSVARALKQTLSASGWYSLALERDRFPGVAVLCYHAVRDDAASDGQLAYEGLHVRASELDAHCRMIRRDCHPISLDDWRAALRGERSLPSRPVLVTFDDGYRSVFTRARPILERHRIPAVAFLCSAPIAERRALWYDVLHSTGGDAAVDRVKEWAGDRWTEFVAGLDTHVDDAAPHALVTCNEVRALGEHPLFEIGAHTATHPILASLTAASQRTELATSRDVIGGWIGRPVRALAYPNGRPRIDYTSETVSIASELGFDSGFTTGERFATADEAALERSRFVMLTGISAAELAHRLAYSWRT